ncbi:MAG: efflux RND transporter periplasmic adaptor subunit [Spongiibacter sp.]|uniref:efflux RND transporter periplasmic adaptor subunit n=1 Tax=Spongiibacter TaxID=630749 RepID=UPI001B291BE1|nr:efflux RND transporter periplasmic adaptor subunit [Spongiibacter sp.]MBO6752888.1 efflux RND transporter periplasmic adaptor subunit [Spongiibacter sp.]
MSCSRLVSPCFRPLVAAALLALVACGESAAPAEQAPAAAPVGVHRVDARELNSTVMLPGRTVAHRVAEVRPQVSGILLKRLFDEGAAVEEGQPLYQIDPAPYRAEQARAEAGLATAQNLWTRYGKLLKSKAVSQQQYDDAFTALQAAKAELEVANINMQHTVVRAPIAGKIGRSMVTEGALVSASQAQELAVVTQLDPIYVDVVQPVSRILEWRESIRAGRLQLSADSEATVTLHVGNNRRYAHSGQLQFSEVNVDPGTGSVTLRAEFPNPDGELLPGMFVHAELNEGSRDDAILLPQQAVLRDPTGQASVWLVGEGNVAERRPVTLLRTVGNTWLLESGVAPGDQVIVDGAMMLREGMPVAPSAPASPVDMSTAFTSAAK